MSCNDQGSQRKAIETIHHIDMTDLLFYSII